MRKVDSFYIYIKVRKEISDILSKNGYDVEKCFKIIEPELSHAFNAIKMQESDLMSHGDRIKKIDPRQTYIWDSKGNTI